MKGHTKIELTNVHTGEVEIIEKHNLVTNVITEQMNMMNRFLAYDKFNTRFTPLYSNALGGLILFDRPLEESVDNCLLPNPSVSSVVGYANDAAYTGSDQRRGSQNTTETQKLTNGYMYVWDFATNQANGEISAVALTSNTAGANPWRYYSNDNVSLNNPYTKDTAEYNALAWGLTTSVSYDFDKCEFLSIRFLNATTLRVVKIKAHIKEIGLFDTYNTCKVIDTKDITLNTSLSLDSSSLFIDGKDGYYYAVYCKSKTMYIARIDENFQFDETYGKKEIVLEHPPSMYLYSYTSAYKYGTIYDGYLYTLQSGHVYKINLSNVDDIEYKYLNASYNGMGMFEMNGVIHAGYYNIFPDLSIEARNINCGGAMVDSTGYYTDTHQTFANKYGIVVGTREYCGRITNFKNYLATINNLESPVTKTSSQTMKITYTITEE